MDENCTTGNRNARLVAMRFVDAAARAEPAIERAEYALEQALHVAALGLAFERFASGKPGELDDAALALERQVAVEGVVGAAKRNDRAEDRRNLRRQQG